MKYLAIVTIEVADSDMPELVAEHGTVALHFDRMLDGSPWAHAQVVGQITEIEEIIL